MVTLGFGFGPRSCVGRQLALLESKIALILFLRRYEKLIEMNPRKIVFGLACKPERSRVRFKKIKGCNI
jgi:cytochrome P450